MPIPVAVRYAAARLLGSQVRDPLMARVFLSIVCCVLVSAAGSATSWSLVHRSVCVCVRLIVRDLQASKQKALARLSRCLIATENRLNSVYLHMQYISSFKCHKGCPNFEVHTAKQAGLHHPTRCVSIFSEFGPNF
jgi:hypothetical protein